MRLHTILVIILLCMGLALGVIFYNTTEFVSTGERFTACDGALHEHVYHGQPMTKECIKK